MKRNHHNVSEPTVMIIPMIDIMLFLLVFFMLSTMYMVNTNTVQVNLPQAAASKLETRPNIVSVTVTDKGDILFDKDSAPTTDLRGQVDAALASDPDTVFVVRGDRGARYENIVVVLDTLKSAGTKHVSIATEQKGGN